MVCDYNFKVFNIRFWVFRVFIYMWYIEIDIYIEINGYYFKKWKNKKAFLRDSYFVYLMSYFCSLKSY